LEAVGPAGVLGISAPGAIIADRGEAQAASSAARDGEAAALSSRTAPVIVAKVPGRLFLIRNLPMLSR
jgi:hypothetical protein